MQVIRDFLDNNNIKENTFVIGVSGGADSLALALMFREEFPSYHLIALTVDHQLRPTSYEEALYVAKIMKDYGIEHHILTWHNDNPETAIEEKAREARYDLLCTWCKEHKIYNLVIAHHLYDQAETFLMRLQRGSGIYGLSAMSEVSFRNGVQILRPLLCTDPQILKDYLRNKNISWVEDESNQCTDFLRVRIRKFLPLLEEKTGISAEKICLAASNLRKTRCFLEDSGDCLIANKVHNWYGKVFSIDFAEFISWHKELQFYVLGKLLMLSSQLSYRPEAEKMMAVLDELKQKEFNSITLGGCLIIKYDLRLWIMTEDRATDMVYTQEEWENFVRQHPEVNGIKFPAKAKQALLR